MKFLLVDDNDTVYGYASRNAAAAGGAERYVWLLARALAAAGWTATVGVRAGLPPGERTVVDGVEFVGVGSGQILAAFARFVASERPDWCHWAGASHLLGPAVAIARAQRARTIYSVQFDLDVRPRAALHRRARLWPLYALGLWGSDRIFLQHRDQYRNLSPVLRKKAAIIPGVVELPGEWTPHAQRRPCVAWVGLLRQPKRPDLLIQIARRAPGVDFVVCGGASDHRSPPGYSDAIIRDLRATPNIRYLGHLPPARAIELIAGASLLLSTSDAEGFPSVFVEAWANGSPTVSLTIDPGGVIQQRHLGRVSRTVDAAASDIVELIACTDARQRMAVRCREYVAQHHSADAAVDAVERALNEEPATLRRPLEWSERP